MKPLKPRAWLGIFFLLLCLYAGITALQNNFHVVIPHELYRSGQLSEGEITDYAKRYDLRSVINLRGDNTGSPWYDQEVAESRAAGVKHIDYRMSSKRLLPGEEALQLIEVMRAAPKPVLIHCNGGANRTSLASALYLAGIKKTDQRTAESQLSIKYGNFPTWLGSKSRMSDTFDNMKDVLGYEGS